MIRNKFAKDEKGAQAILLGAVLLSLVVAAFLLVPNRGNETLDAAERARLEASTRRN